MTQATLIASPVQIVLVTYASMYTAAKDNALEEVLTMAEYIERDELISDIDAAMENAGMGYVVGQTMKRYVKRVPAADVAPVRHGYWRPILHVGRKTDYECSCCLGIIADVPDDDEHDLCAWCSMCGAKMDGAAHAPD